MRGNMYLFKPRWPWVKEKVWKAVRAAKGKVLIDGRPERKKKSYKREWSLFV